VLSERVRRRIEPKKGGPDTWLEVHREAHRRGFKSTATMMYGHVEQTDDLLDHLDAIRELQDLHGGLHRVRAVVVQARTTRCSRSGSSTRRARTCTSDARGLALYLDNFPHVQASWFSEGKRTGQIALHFGADDWGGTCSRRTCTRQAAFVNTIAVEEIVT
jgi:cyclic dehypoxanthinyl futalosine synthase